MNQDEEILEEASDIFFKMAAVEAAYIKVVELIKSAIFYALCIIASVLYAYKTAGMEWSEQTKDQVLWGWVLLLAIFYIFNVYVKKRSRDALMSKLALSLNHHMAEYLRQRSQTQEQYERLLHKFKKIQEDELKSFRSQKGTQ